MKSSFKQFLGELDTTPQAAAQPTAQPTAQPAVDPQAQQQAQQQAASSQQLIQLQQTLMQKETAKSRLEKEIFDLKKRMSQIELASVRASQ